MIHPRVLEGHTAWSLLFSKWAAGFLGLGPKHHLLCKPRVCGPCTRPCMGWVVVGCVWDADFTHICSSVGMSHQPGAAQAPGIGFPHPEKIMRSPLTLSSSCRLRAASSIFIKELLKNEMQKQNSPFIIQNDDKWQFESRTICSRVEAQDLNWVCIFFTLRLFSSVASCSY